MTDKLQLRADVDAEVARLLRKVAHAEDAIENFLSPTKDKDAIASERKRVARKLAQVSLLRRLVSAAGGLT